MSNKLTLTRSEALYAEAKALIPGGVLGIRKPGDRDSNLDSTHFNDWGKFRFTAYKLTRVAARMNWIVD